ncbi:hypothetical protein ACIHCM_33190 [Streptomyces sp. NPDC052023]|uniref:hypothetical protein n=1 Tax=Streptomyces sp. NPDC052023 TaxID=3365681 RepID=UPI0037D0CABE
MTVEGTWEISIATPMGKQQAVLELTSEDGVLQGHAKGQTEDVVLEDIVQDGNRLTWAQKITKPMRLTLHFDVLVDGDEMTGTSKASALPTAKITGRRISA